MERLETCGDWDPRTCLSSNSFQPMTEIIGMDTDLTVEDGNTEMTT